MTNMTKKLLAPWRDIVPIAKVLPAVISISLLGTYFLVSNSGERLYQPTELLTLNSVSKARPM